MQPRPQPIFATDRTAAQMLELPVDRFRELVAEGILPRPVNVGREERWDVEALQKALRGEQLYQERPQW